MINCRQLCELLVDFVSGELSPENKTLIEEHLQWCPPCVTYLETYQLTIKLTRHLPCAPLPPELERRLREAWKEMQPKKECDRGGPGPRG